MSDKPFTQVYEWKEVIRMGNAAKNVFMALTDAMDNQNGVIIGIHSLSGAAGLSVRQANRGVKELREMGAIEVTPAGKMAIYLLNPEIVWEDKPWRRSEAKIPIMWVRDKGNQNEKE